MHRDETAPVSGVDDGKNDVNRDEGEGVSPKQICVGGNSRKAASRADGRNIEKDDANDFAETEGDDGQIITFQSK
jgi:hypothetical protein